MHDPVKRVGPSPLPVHMGFAASALRDDAAASARFLAGVRKYQTHAYVRDMAILPEVWRCGEVRLLKASGAGEGRGAPLLVIPSMVNRSTVFDLLPEQSFVRWVSGQGRDVYLLDWGEPTDDPGLEDIDGLVSGRLIPALEFVSREAGGLGAHALGYCLGGMFLAAAGVMRPELLRSCMFFAAPWDFHAAGVLSGLCGSVAVMAPAGEAMMRSCGYMPMRWVQSVFAGVDPDGVVRKFSAFADMDAESAAARRFVAAEDWLNDGVDLPVGVARACVQQFYVENLPGQGIWDICGRRICPEQLSMPALIVAAERDRIVPVESSLALAHLLPKVEMLRVGTGHIGLLCGADCMTRVWEPVIRWMENLD